MESITFLQAVCVTFITGIFGVIIAIIKKRNKGSELLSEELEETIGADGSRHTKQKKLFKQ